MGMYERFVRPIFFLQDPEKIHDRFVLLGRLSGSNPITRGFLRLMYGYKNQILRQTVAGITFDNPIGLAAGFDKDCKLMKALPCMGFGYEEVGSITAEPYEGNPQPRLKRLKADEGIIVFYGLKNEGAEKLRHKLDEKFAFPIGVSVAKTNKNHKTQREKLDDWITGLKLMKDYGDFITINLSCPNTFDPANFCDPDLLEKLLLRIESDKIVFNKPVFLKVTADLTTQEADKIMAMCDKRAWITGFVISNLVKDRSTITLKSPKEEYEPYKGGISGPLVKPKALKLVRHFRKRAKDRYVIIGCGGISNAEDAYEFITAGASLIQLITGMIYHGPGAMKQINKGLVKLLKRDGFQNISDAVGSNRILK